jgi:hypothetical protein
MNAVAHISFESAYRQLMPAEKLFVDGYVDALEKAAANAKEGIRQALQRPIPAEVIAATGGMLDRPLVRAAIVELVNDIASAAELNVARVIKHVNAIAFSNIADYWSIGEDGKPAFDFSKATPQQLLALKSVDYKEDLKAGRREIKVTLHDKVAALFKYMEMFGLTEPDNPHIRVYAQRPASPAVAGRADNSNVAMAESYARLLQSGALA